MKRFGSLFLTLPLFILIGGCWDQKDIEYLDYITALGFDYVDDNYVVYLQTLEFSTLAHNEGGAKVSEDIPVWVGKGVGETPYAAFFDIYRTAQQRVYWGHISAVVLSETFLKQNLKENLDFVVRFPFARFNIWVYGTKHPIEKILVTESLYFLSSLQTILHEPVGNFEQHSVLQPIQLYRFMNLIFEPGQTIILPTIEVNKNQWKKGMQEGVMKNENLMQVDGAFFIHNNRLQGWFKRENLLGIRWTQQKTLRTELYLHKEGKPVGVLVLKKPKTKVTSYVKDDKPHFKLDVQVGGHLHELRERLSLKELEELAEKTIKKELRDTYLHGLEINADLLQLDHQFYRAHVREWKKIDHDTLPLTEESLEEINVRVKLKTSGSEKFQGNLDGKQEP